MKNKKILFVALSMLSIFSWACDACNLRQPKITRNITHGTGPESNWDWFLVGLIALITILTLYYSIKYLIKPGEKNREHIKHRIILEEHYHDKR